MRKLLISFCLSACCTLLAAQNAPSIQEAMANYDYETALTLIGQAPASIPLLYQKGTALKGLGRNAEALTVYQDIITQDSLNPRAYIEAAECCKPLAKQREALEYYRHALRLNPDHKYARLQYIALLMGMKRYRESLSEAESLARTDSSAYVLHLRAESMEQVYPNDSIGQVIKAYQEIRRRFPEDYLSAAKLGNIHIAGQDYPEAIGVTEEYRAIDSTNMAVNRINAQAYCLDKDYPQAIERYNRLLAEKDSTFQTCFYAGISHYAVEDFYKAHDVLECALKQDRTNINVLYYLGRSCAKTSWKKRGVECLEKAVQLSIPNDSAMARLYIGLADCYKMDRQYKKQIETLLEQYEKYEPQKHRLLYDAAFVSHFLLKDSKKAEEYLEAYLKTRPQESKQETEEEGTLVITEHNRYNAAQNWLNDLRKKRKEEEFFKGEQGNE